jgi:hypothetical protein
MLDLQAVTKWFEDHVEWFKEQGATLEHRRPITGTPNNGTYVDVDTPRHVARVTVWESGFCDLEALDVDTGNSVFWEHHEFSQTAEVLVTLDQFARRVLEGNFQMPGHSS